MPGAIARTAGKLKAFLHMVSHPQGGLSTQWQKDFQQQQEKANFPSLCSTFSNVSLAKGSYLARPRLKGERNKLHRFMMGGMAKPH